MRMHQIISLYILMRMQQKLFTHTKSDRPVSLETLERSLFLTHPTKWEGLFYDINVSAKIK